MKNKNLHESFSNALQGIIHTLRHERNFKIHIGASIAAVAMAIFLKIDMRDLSLVVLAIGLVLTAELLNTAIEAMVDLYCRGRSNQLAKIAKDAAAGGVLVASVCAVIIGYMVFFNRIVNLIFG